MMFFRQAERERAARQKQLEQERDNYQRQIQFQNIKNLELQNSALSASIAAMNRPRESAPATITSQIYGPPPSQSQTESANFPSLAEIRGMIESSQARAEEDFTGKINLLQNQERQRQEEEQVTARNAASRTLSYQRGAAGQAWESALRGR